MSQTGAGDVHAFEVKLDQMLQRGQMGQACVGYGSPFERQYFKGSERRKVNKRGVIGLRIAQVQLQEQGRRAQMSQPFSANRRVGDVQLP